MNFLWPQSLNFFLHCCLSLDQVSIFIGVSSIWPLKTDYLFQLHCFEYQQNNYNFKFCCCKFFSSSKFFVSSLEVNRKKRAQTLIAHFLLCSSKYSVPFIFLLCIKNLTILKSKNLNVIMRLRHCH